MTEASQDRPAARGALSSVVDVLTLGFLFREVPPADAPEAASETAQRDFAEIEQASEYRLASMMRYPNF